MSKKNIEATNSSKDNLEETNNIVNNKENSDEGNFLKLERNNLLYLIYTIPNNLVCKYPAALKMMMLPDLNF